MTTSTGFRDDAFAGRRVLVVGGTSGIGAGIARGFAAHGAQVQVTGATAAEVARAEGLDAQVLDVRDGAAVKALVGALLDSALDPQLNLDLEDARKLLRALGLVSPITPAK